MHYTTLVLVLVIFQKKLELFQAFSVPAQRLNLNIS